MDIFNIKKVKDLEAKLCKSIEILDRQQEALDSLKEMAEGFKGIAQTYQLKYEIAEREVNRLRAENEALKAKPNN
jgi:FtsZ-binding cell division protein ZapB